MLLTKTQYRSSRRSLRLSPAVPPRFVAMFELGTVRRMFQRAPIAFWFALFVTLGFSLPLYLLKIEYVPRETVWLPSVVL